MMRSKTGFLLRAAATGLAMVVLTSIATAQRPSPGSSQRSQIFDLGKGMSAMSTNLIQVAAQSAMFLQFSDQIGLTSEQQKKLEEIYLDAQKFSVRRQLDLDIADAELRRLLSNEQVDLAAVKLKLKEAEVLRSEQTLNSIAAVLQAIRTLTHAQHIKIMLLVRNLPKESQPALPVS